MFHPFQLAARSSEGNQSSALITGFSPVNASTGGALPRLGGCCGVSSALGGWRTPLDAANVTGLGLVALPEGLICASGREDGT